MGRMIYRLPVGTGFRAGEFQSLTLGRYSRAILAAVNPSPISTYAMPRIPQRSKRVRSGEGRDTKRGTLFFTFLLLSSAPIPIMNNKVGAETERGSESAP